MTTQKAVQLATEKMQTDFTFFNELKEAFDKLRKTDMSATSVKKSGIKELTQKYTGINIDFGIENSGQINAYMMTPELDGNHPFYTTRGWRFAADKKAQRKAFGKEMTTEAWVNDADYTVGGAWSKVEVKLRMLKGLMNHTTFTADMITAIFLHELGHVYTYFSLFGRLSTKNFLTMEAIKELTSSQPLEKRIMALEVLEKDLNIHIANKESLCQGDEAKRAQMVESVVITAEAAGGSNTTTSPYETRNIEQIADQFAVYHGSGAALAEGLTEMMKVFRTPETFSKVGFIIMEVVKVLFITYVTLISPILSILILLLAIPGNKVYDDPEARVEVIRKQLVQSLKDTKGQPELHKAILEQIKTIEMISGKLKDRRSFYTLVYQTITPRGRTMYRQEVFMKAMENLLYNDTYLNAAKFGALNNES